jgi:hypothetical protein
MRKVLSVKLPVRWASTRLNSASDKHPLRVRYGFTHIGFPTETVIVFIALSVGAIFIDLFMHRHDKPIS